MSPLSGPPETPRRPVHRTVGAVSYVDDYAWLEDETAEVEAWQSAQAAWADGVLAASPSLAAMQRHLAALAGTDDIEPPRPAGGLWFRAAPSTQSSSALLQVADTPYGPWRALHPAGLTLGDLRVIMFVPSPDGRRVALSWAGPDAVETFQVIAVPDGSILLSHAPQTRVNFCVWTPDADGLFYRGEHPAIAQGMGRVYHHRLGEAPPAVPEPVVTSHPLCWPVGAADGSHVLIYTNHLSPRPEFIRPMTGQGEWMPFLEGVPGMFRGPVKGGVLYAITDDAAARGRLVAIPLEASNDRTRWRELVAASDVVLASVVVVGTRLVLVELVDTYARIRVLRTDGTDVGQIPLPGNGMVALNAGPSVAINFTECLSPCGPEEMVFQFSSMVCPPALYRANVVSLTCERAGAAPTPLAAEVTDRTAISADGTPIPYRVVMNERDAASGPRPTVVFQLAGFNLALLPGWPGSVLAAWVRAGGVLVLAHLRGGGELGSDWWRAGQREGRARTFQDLYAVADALIADGVTTPAQLAIDGTSNGAMIAAAAAVARPDLFAAAAMVRPITDLLGLTRDPISLMISRSEEGDPDDEADSLRLVGWSPFHQVANHGRSAAMLIDVSDADARSRPWHGRKLAARAQATRPSQRPILLRTVTTDAANVGKLAFFADQLGLKP